MQVQTPVLGGPGPTDDGSEELDAEPPRPPRAIGPHIFLSPEQVVRRALVFAAAHKDDLIAVAGPDGLLAMVSLCRAGYERVECARQATCAGAEDACDLLLVVGLMNSIELAETVRRTAGLLCDDGRLIVQLSRPGDDALVRQALDAAGLEAPFSLTDRSAGRLVMLKVRHTAPIRKTG